MNEYFNSLQNVCGYDETLKIHYTHLTHPKYDQAGSEHERKLQTSVLVAAKCE